MPSTVRPRYTRWPRGSTVRCKGCGRTGTPGQITGHISSSRTCKGAEIELVTLPPGADHIVSPIVQAVARPLPPPMTPPTIELAPPPPPPDADEGATPPEAEAPFEDDDEPDDEPEAPDDDGPDDEVLTPIMAVPATPDRRRNGRPGTAGDRSAPPPVFAEQPAWKAGYLSPDTHVYYRMARTDPRFAELFGSNSHAPNVFAFADEIVHAFFVLNLRYGLGLASLEAPEPAVDDELITIPVRQLRDVVMEMLHDGRTATHAGAA